MNNKSIKFREILHMLKTGRRNRDITTEVNEATSEFHNDVKYFKELRMELKKGNAKIRFTHVSVVLISLGIYFLMKHWGADFKMAASSMAACVIVYLLSVYEINTNT